MDCDASTVPSWSKVKGWCEGEGSMEVGWDRPELQPCARPKKLVLTL